VIWPTVLPRWVADKVTRLRRGEPFRTYLYNPSGYRRLMRDAGFPSARVFDLISSYNDYDFIVDASDTPSYRYLYRQELVRPFFGLAGRARKMMGSIVPGALGELSYAYLVLAGNSTATILDATHPMWKSLESAGGNPGRFRLAIPGQDAAQLAVLCHDGHRATAIVEISTTQQSLEVKPFLPDHLQARLSGSFRPTAEVKHEDVWCRLFLPVVEQPRG
jgi:hypothetical protein